VDKLSATGEAIRHYKHNASGGYEEWSKVPCTADYRMHVPSMGFNTDGAAACKDVIFGWLTDIGAEQELVDIVEHGPCVICNLKITDKDGVVLLITEVFRLDDNGRVEEIGAL
jgi:hypothetical protein